MLIKKYKEIDLSQQKKVEEIFFNTSLKKDFKSLVEKEEFLYKYFGYYHKYFGDYFLVALEDEVPLGYICGVNRLSKIDSLREYLPALEIFSKEEEKFPSHLHINLDPCSQGKGLGGKLIDSFCALLDTNGVHIITAANARNVSFYTKQNFNFNVVKKINNIDLIFMGKVL